MDITVPFLIVVIIISLFLLYKIAGINFLVVGKNKKPKAPPPEPKKEEPKVETKKSFIHKKEKPKQEKKEEITNKPSNGAEVTQVFAAKQSESAVNKAILDVDASTNSSQDLLKDVAKNSGTISNAEPSPIGFGASHGQMGIPNRNPFESRFNSPNRPPFDSPFGDKKFGDMFFDDIRNDKKPVEPQALDEETIKKRMVGEVVATTKSNKKTGYWN